MDHHATDFIYARRRNFICARITFVCPSHTFPHAISLSRHILPLSPDQRAYFPKVHTRYKHRNFLLLAINGGMLVLIKVNGSLSGKSIFCSFISDCGKSGSNFFLHFVPLLPQNRFCPICPKRSTLPKKK